MKKLLAVLLLLVTASAFADLPSQPRFTWTPPTEFTDGTALDPATDLSEYRLSCQGAANVAQVIPAPAVEWQAPAGLFQPGDYTCAMTAVDKAGIESAPSTAANFTKPAPFPLPTMNLTIH